MYLTQNSRLTKKGEWVDVVSKPHPHVWLVRNSRGDVHSVRVDILSDDKPIEEVKIEVKEINLFNQI